MASTTSKILFIACASLIIIGVFLLSQKQSDSDDIVSEKPPTQQSATIPETNEKSTTTITLVVPENEVLYREKMTEFTQMGGENPLDTMTFIEKEIEIPYTTDIAKASAEMVAGIISPIGGGSINASLVYFEMRGNTAYVLLDIHTDRWAGSAVSIAIINPIIEKTLLRLPEINEVIFDRAPDNK